MEKFSSIADKRRQQTEIVIHPCLRDHCFEGRVVYPAVEAMQFLAAFVRREVPNLAVTCMEQVSFDKFLPIPDEAERLSAICEIERHADSAIHVSLLTKIKAGKSGFARLVSHASLSFNLHRPVSRREKRVIEEFLSMQKPLEAFSISSKDLYRDLVPFAPAFQNIIDHAWIGSSSGGAMVHAAEHETLPGPLGSPFPLDAAFHVACAWSQHHRGIVAFPVGFERRRIFHILRSGKDYRALVIARQTADPVLIFDIALLTGDHTICELVSGVKMRDVSSGRVKPPGWVLKENTR